ncbi:MAG TPA: 4-hydroxy-tetrahydrodipicolinate synthase [Blastocatellia bacterium]|jgi:4-hydroxy-tetrahydrodipicolinate synthase|nr:4-hydroxy-tetrahydrodipicolinate synthase [Blastocatellia bacterium]
MLEIANLKGCGTALVTPFKDDLSIDEEALRGLVEFQVSEGIDFLVPCGTTGESATLSADEQRRVVEVVIQSAQGRVQVIAGAGGNNTAHVIELAAEYERMGVRGLLSVSPYYNHPTQEGIYQHFRAIAESTRLPIIIYNVPPRTAVNILPGTVARLSEIPNIVGVKEASGDISQVAEIFSLVRDDFKVFSGDDSMTLPVVALGGAGVISVASNEAPAQMAALTRAALENEWDESRRLNRELLPLMKANFIETSPGPVKAALAMMGKIKEVYRLPMVPVSGQTRERLRAVLAGLKLI